MINLGNHKIIPLASNKIDIFRWIINVDKNNELNNDHNNFIKNTIHLQRRQTWYHTLTDSIGFRVTQPIDLSKNTLKNPPVVHQIPESLIVIPEVIKYASETRNVNQKES